MSWYKGAFDDPGSWTNIAFDPLDFGGGRGEEAQERSIEAQEKAAKLMARTLLEAVDKSISYQEAAEMRAYEHVKPWRTAGVSALDQIGRLLKEDKGPGEFTTSPGYEWRLGEGEKAINRMASSRGKYFAPATGKALVEHGQNVATNEYDNFLRRYYEKKNQTLQPYMQLAGLGQGSAGTAANAAVETGSGGANRMMDATAMGQNALLAAAGNRATSYMDQYNAQQARNTSLIGGILAAIL